MYLYQYVLLTGFTCLLLFKRTRLASFAFLSGWFVYLMFFYGLDSVYKYGACSTIEVAIAYVLNNRFRFVAYLGYSLLFVNLYGMFIYLNNHSAYYYDGIYALISITQFLFIMIRVIPSNGIYRLPSKHFMVRLIDFDSCRTYDRMWAPDGPDHPTGWG